mgnify:CR=1 FL=1
MTFEGGKISFEVGKISSKEGFSMSKETINCSDSESFILDTRNANVNLC